MPRKRKWEMLYMTDAQMAGMGVGLLFGYADAMIVVYFLRRKMDQLPPERRAGVQAMTRYIPFLFAILFPVVGYFLGGTLFPETP
jgi:hypothetical protein